MSSGPLLLLCTMVLYAGDKYYLALVCAVLSLIGFALEGDK